MSNERSSKDTSSGPIRLADGFDGVLLRYWRRAASARSARFSRLWFAFFSTLFILFFFLLIAVAVALYRETQLILAQEVSSWTTDSAADCAVVLTGGPNRVREGIDLLSRRAVQKLIVSGVHPQVAFRDIFPQWPYYGELLDRDVVLERRSRTTFGNAQQSWPLVEALECRDLVLITSQVHMYRALRTFRAEFPPGFPITARSVSSGQVTPELDEVAVEAIKSLFYSVWAY